MKNAMRFHYPLSFRVRAARRNLKPIFATRVFSSMSVPTEIDPRRPLYRAVEVLDVVESAVPEVEEIPLDVVEREPRARKGPRERERLQPELRRRPLPRVRGERFARHAEDVQRPHRVHETLLDVHRQAPEGPAEVRVAELPLRLGVRDQ